MRFEEKQNMISPWILIIMAVVFGSIIYPHINDLKSIWKDPGFYILFVVFGLLFLMNLTTRYDEEGIYINFIPLVWNKRISWKEIQYARVETYGLFDYGGWGYRMGKSGTAITAKGKYGMKIALISGKFLLIGTQHPEEIQRIINHYLPIENES
ncbi:DUF6141 family protein [Sphingobacterium kyonggiense]